MRQEQVTFAAARTQKSFWQVYRIEWILLLVSAPFVWMGVGDEQVKWEEWMFYGLWWVLAVYLVYRYFTRGKMKTFEYRLTDEELLIQTRNKKPVRYPLSSIKQFSILTLEPKPTAIFGNRAGELYRGTWKWNFWELTLYATRRDRLLLLDTTAGLIGLTPAREEEDAFFAQLQKRTGLTPSQDDFTPVHAERPASVWPALLMALVLGADITVLVDLYSPVDNEVMSVLRGIVYGVVVLSMGSMYRWRKRRPFAFWMAFVGMCLLFVALLSFL